MNAGGYLIKLHHSIVGLPDRMLIMPWQPIRLIEFKRKGEQFSNVQGFWVQKFGGMGHPILRIDSVEEFRHMIGG